MFTRNPRHIPWKRSLAVAAVATAGLSGAAVASPYWTDIVNNSHATTINEAGKPGNYRIWGLGYAKLIVGGQGNNILVGDGHCPAGATDPDYCDVDPIPGSGSGHVIKGGGGSNAIYSGYGPGELLYGGQGYNYIRSAPTSSTIYGGPTGDAINGDQGSTTIYPGTGTNYIFAQSSKVDYVYCTGSHDTVYAYHYDVIKHCATVIYQQVPAPSADQGAKTVKNAQSHATARSHKKTKKTKKTKSHRSHR